MIMSKAIKILAVVVISAFVGWIGATAICAQVFQDGKRVELVRGQHGPDNTHMRIVYDHQNYGAPGVLEVRAKIEVVLPETSPHVPDAREYDVWIRVGESDGTLLIPLIKIDHVTDRKGVGHWSKDVSWVIPDMEPGEYSVGIYVATEQMVNTSEDGVFPNCEVGSRHLMTVE
jgi:hypothetical protein